MTMGNPPVVGTEGADPPAKPNGERKPFGIDFLDPLFAVAIHIGLVERVMSEQWFKDWTIPAPASQFMLVVFSMSLTNVVLSWFGYHASIRKRPLQGIVRFALDVMLVLTYAVLLVRADNLGATLFILAFVFFLFVLWDIFKIWEYRKPQSIVAQTAQTQTTPTPQTPAAWGMREWVSVTYFLLFSMLSVLHHFEVQNEKWGIFLAFVFTFAYRLEKELPVIARVPVVLWYCILMLPPSLRRLIVWTAKNLRKGLLWIRKICVGH